MAQFRARQGIGPRVRILLPAPEALLHVGGALEHFCGPGLVPLGRTVRRGSRSAARGRRRAAHHRHRRLPVAALPVVLRLFRGGHPARSTHSGPGSARIPGRTGRSSGSGVAAVHHLFPGAGLGGRQQLVRPVLGPDPGHSGQDGHLLHRRGLWPDRQLPRAGARRRHGQRAHRLLRQPLHLPLAHGDEQLLHGSLADPAPHRGRLAARAGRHDALLHDHGRARRQLHRFDHDADRLLPGADPAVGQHHRTAGGRPDRASAGGCRPALVDLRHRAAGRRRLQAAGAAVPQPARRGGLPQGTGLRRGQ